MLSSISVKHIFILGEIIWVSVCCKIRIRPCVAITIKQNFWYNACLHVCLGLKRLETCYSYSGHAEFLQNEFLFGTFLQGRFVKRE